MIFGIFEANGKMWKVGVKEACPRSSSQKRHLNTLELVESHFPDSVIKLRGIQKSLVKKVS